MKEELERALRDRGLVLKDLADYLGINISSLYRKMNEETFFTRVELVGIARFLDFSIEDIRRVFFYDL